MRIALIGLGCSASEYAEGFDLTIGVNDVWRKVRTDVLVCLDKRSAFSSDRLRVIDQSKPQAFYSQIVAWDTRPDFHKIELYPTYPDRVCRLDGPKYEKSFFSPYVAMQIAYKEYHATELHVFGVDMTNHPHLKGNLLKKIRLHFDNLRNAMTDCKIIVYGNGILKD